MLKYKMEPKDTKETRKDILVQDFEPSPVIISHNTSALMQNLTKGLKKALKKKEEEHK